MGVLEYIAAFRSGIQIWQMSVMWVQGMKQTFQNYWVSYDK